jgi:hypothetical protein
MGDFTNAAEDILEKQSQIYHLQYEIKEEKARLLTAIIQQMGPQAAIMSGMITLNLRSVARVARRMK